MKNPRRRRKKVRARDTAGGENARALYMYTANLLRESKVYITRGRLHARFNVKVCCTRACLGRGSILKARPAASFILWYIFIRHEAYFRGYSLLFILEGTLRSARFDEILWGGDGGWRWYAYKAGSVLSLISAFFGINGGIVCGDVVC